MTPLMDEVVTGIHLALARAQRDYDSWTGGDWLWQAPEYLLTAYIARQIASRRKDRTFYIALESNVGVSIDDAGGVGRGKVSDRLRLNGRFDILLSWASGNPRAIIEVKNRVVRFADIEEDVARIVSVLRRERTSFWCGLISFYTSWIDGHIESARARVLHRVQEIESDVNNYVTQKEMKLKRYGGRVKVVDESAWMTEVIKISRQSVG